MAFNEALAEGIPSSDESFLRLHRFGWSIGDTAGSTPDGLVWLVSGSNGENLVRAEGRTRDEAWRNAEIEALGLGMLGRDRGPREPRSQGRLRSGSHPTAPSVAEQTEAHQGRNTTDDGSGTTCGWRNPRISPPGNCFVWMFR
jgi:hypothetical protein